jgi:predicted DCC family thiol-disulfide oxidoreductase YuxK
MIPAPAFPLTVYYDASCPLCRAEMEAMKARDARDVLRLVDCSAPAFDGAACAAEGVTPATMMARIHARDADGRWWRGLDVFAAVYGAAGYGRAVRVYASPLLRPLLDRVYPWIADHRYLLSRLPLPRLFRMPTMSSGAACPVDTRVPNAVRDEPC